MTYQKSYRSRGIILVDIVIALALAALFVSIISESSQGGRSLFGRASERNQLMDEYEAGQSRVSLIPYGNDRTESIESVGSSTIPGGMTAGTYDRHELAYDRVASMPYASLNDAAGTALCSVDFMKSAASQSGAVHTGEPVITSVLLPIDPQTLLAHLEVRNGIAYISAFRGGGSYYHLLVVDIRDPANPAILARAYPTYGVPSFALAGKRLFTAVSSAAGQAQSNVIQSQRIVALEYKYRIPLPFATATPTVASSIFYDRGYIYLGTEKWDGDEFNIIDASVPAHLAKVSGFEIGSKVTSIYVKDGLAYVASADMDELRVIDVHDHAHPFVLASFVPTGWQRQEGEAVTLFEGAVNLARTSGGYDVPTDPEAYVWTTVSTTTLADYHSVNIPGGAYGIVADRSHVFLATRQAGKEFQIFDRALSADSAVAYALPTEPQSLTCDNDRLYVLSHTAPYIYQISFN